MRQLVIGVLVILMAAGCGLLDSGDMADCSDVGVRYAPADYVTIVEESCSPGFAPGNAAYRATLRIPAAAIGAFQESTGLTEWATDKTQAQIFDEEVTPLSSILLATYVDGAYLREVLIDTSADPYTVYYYHAFID